MVTAAANYFALRMVCLQVAHMRTHVQHAARWCIQQKFPAKFKSRIVRPTESSVAPTDGRCRTDHKWRLHQTAELRGTDRDCRPRPPVLSVAFRTYKKTSCLSCLPAAKAHKRRLRHTETAGPGPGLPPKQQGPEGRTGSAGHGPHCLTLLSEPTRKLAV